MCLGATSWLRGALVGRLLLTASRLSSDGGETPAGGTSQRVEPSPW